MNVPNSWMCGSSEHIILMGTSTKLSFLTWNIDGFKSKTEEVKTEIEKHNCNVAFIQETHINSTDKNVFASLDHWKSFYTNYKPKERGVAILIRKEIVGKSKTWTRKDTTGCYIVVKCTIKGQRYTLVSVYVHQVDSRPLKRLQMILENFAEGILLIGGDFNIALNPYLDRDSSTKNERHFMLKPTVEKFMTSFHLVDVWRRLNPIARQYTYSKGSTKKKIPVSRLDYVFVPEESVQCVESCRISEENCCSDHQPVLFKIRCNTNRKSTNHLDVSGTEEKMIICKFVFEDSKQWQSCKEKFWAQKFVFTYSQDAFKIINVVDVQKAIESFAGNENVKRKDGVSLLFYKSYYWALIPYLCAFYHKVLEQPMTIPQSFNEGYAVFQHHYIFNVDYLILATIMARWLSDHLDSHSTDYTVDKTTKQKVLFTFKKGPKKVPWNFLQSCLTTEQQRKPRLHTKFKIDILENILKNSSDRKYKTLYWGCPLTPVLMRLCLTHVAERFVKQVYQPEAKIHISKDNVIVSLSEDVGRDLLKKAETELPCVHCKFVDELRVATNPSNS